LNEVRAGIVQRLVGAIAEGLETRPA